MRTLIVVALLSLAACSVNQQYSEPWTVKAVGKTYEAARCLSSEAGGALLRCMHVRCIERRANRQCELPGRDGCPDRQQQSAQGSGRDSRHPPGYGFPGDRLRAEGPRPEQLGQQDEDGPKGPRGRRDERGRKIALANLMIRKAGLIRTIRHEMNKQGVVYSVGLTEISRRSSGRKKKTDAQPRKDVDMLRSILTTAATAALAGLGVAAQAQTRRPSVRRRRPASPRRTSARSPAKSRAAWASSSARRRTSTASSRGPTASARSTRARSSATASISASPRNRRSSGSSSRRATSRRAR